MVRDNTSGGMITGRCFVKSPFPKTTRSDAKENAHCAARSASLSGYRSTGGTFVAQGRIHWVKVESIGSGSNPAEKRSEKILHRWTRARGSLRYIWVMIAAAEGRLVVDCRSKGRRSRRCIMRSFTGANRVPRIVLITRTRGEGRRSCNTEPPYV